MTKLKVVKSDEAMERKDEVVAGQVRMCKESESAHEVVVLIVDARSYDSSVFTEDEPYFPIILRGVFQYHPGITYGSCSAEEIAKEYPIVLDATLTYKEVE